MKKKSKIIVCMAALFALLSASACQDTPDEEVVITANNTEKQVMEAAEKYKDIESVDFEYEVPEHVTLRYSIVDNYTDMVIDADVIMPDVDSIPVAKVASDPFTQERADELREYFMQDGELVSEWIPTKSYYDDLIVEAKKGHIVDGEYVFDEDSQQWVDELLQMREDAPDEDVQELITDYSISQGNGLSGRIVIDGEVKGSISINENRIYFSTDRGYRLADQKNYDEMTGEEIEIPQKEIDFSADQAEEIAQSFLSELGIEGMGVVESEKIYYYADSDYYSIECGGYSITLMRELGGLLPAKEVGFGVSSHDSFDFSPPVEAETISVVVSEYGEITFFSWRNPIKIIELMTIHVDILSFDDILARLEEWSKIQYAYLEDYSSDLLWIKDIYEIRLGLNYLPIQNNPNEFMYAPCWFFVYKDWMEYTDEQKAEIYDMGGYMMHWDGMGDEYFIFSAIDGASVSVYTQEILDEIMEESSMVTPLPED